MIDFRRTDGSVQSNENDRTVKAFLVIIPYAIIHV